ncbi:MAG: DapH/DapD/GlmU-related protein [Candidatus Thorarchaeota archaeon]|jgi:acetyltransferase-like isoleucine patch superfamily enzyme
MDSYGRLNQPALEESLRLKPKFMAYALYMALSMLLSLFVAAMPAVFLFLAAFQNLDSFFAGFGWPFVDIQGYFVSLFTGVLPAFAFERFWFFVLIVPLGLFCYGLFLAVLCAMFVLSRRAIPHLDEGIYNKENGEWLFYEFYQAFYTLYSHFTWFFSAFLNARLLYIYFGAKIGRGTVVGGGHILTPDRLVIGKNCIIGYGSLLCPHMYDGDRLYIKTIKLGNNVTVGGHAMVFAGAEVGDNSIVAANSVVGKDRVIPPNSIWIHGKIIPKEDMSPMAIQAVRNPAPPLDEEDDSSVHSEA